MLQLWKEGPQSQSVPRPPRMAPPKLLRGGGFGHPSTSVQTQAKDTNFARPSVLPSTRENREQPCSPEPTPKVSTTLTTGTYGDEVMVRGKVDNCATTMLVDSGSQITIVRKDVLPGWLRKIEPTTIQPAAVNGTPLTFLGRTLVDLAVMDVSLGSTWVYVISPDHMTNEMILGTDVLEKLGSITINFQEKTVGLDTVCVPTVVSPT